MVVKFMVILPMVFRIAPTKIGRQQKIAKKSFSQETEEAMFLAKFVVPRNLFSDQTPEKKRAPYECFAGQKEVQDT